MAQNIEVEMYCTHVNIFLSFSQLVALTMVATFSYPDVTLWCAFQKREEVIQVETSE